MAAYYDPKTYPKQWNFLEPGTVLDQYIIERKLAHGGFSSVYLARQMSNQSQVAIKEYLPRKFAHRTWNNVIVPNSKETEIFFLKGRALFFKEAKALAKLKHLNIVNVINFFQANDTVYMVMAYDKGSTLDKVIKNKKSKVTEKQLIKMFNLLLAGISMMHKKNFLHLDIKPSNILIRPNSTPVLLDFGAIQKFTSTPKKNESTIISHGFSPVEQYSKNSQLGPWTDIYSIGATMYFCLSGKAPVFDIRKAAKKTIIPATKVFNNKYPHHLLYAIDWAMKDDPKKRPQSVEIFRHALLNT